MRFTGFASGAQPTPLPAALLRDLAPAMDDPAELLVTLYACEALARVRRFPRMLHRTDLEESRPLIEALARMCAERETSRAFADGLEAAIERCSLLTGRSQRDGKWIEWIALNDADGQRAMASEAAIPPRATVPGRAALGSNAAEIYQDAFGTPPPPILVDALADAETRYGIEWLRDACLEAAANNARSWRYVCAILDRWESEGRDRIRNRNRDELEERDVGTDAAQHRAGSVESSRYRQLFRG